MSVLLTKWLRYMETSGDCLERLQVMFGQELDRTFVADDRVMPDLCCCHAAEWQIYCHNNINS